MVKLTNYNFSSLGIIQSSLQILNCVTVKLIAFVLLKSVTNLSLETLCYIVKPKGAPLRKTQGFFTVFNCVIMKHSSLLLKKVSDFKARDFSLHW